VGLVEASFEFFYLRHGLLKKWFHCMHGLFDQVDALFSVCEHFCVAQGTWGIAVFVTLCSDLGIFKRCADVKDTRAAEAVAILADDDMRVVTVVFKAYGTQSGYFINEIEALVDLGNAFIEPRHGCNGMCRALLLRFGTGSNKTAYHGGAPQTSTWDRVIDYHTIP
jgi:hypothetical protein